MGPTVAVDGSFKTGKKAKDTKDDYAIRKYTSATVEWESQVSQGLLTFVPMHETATSFSVHGVTKMIKLKESAAIDLAML